MSLIHGKNGVVKIGILSIAELTNFDIDESIATVDATAMGDDSEKHLTGAKSWNGSLVCQADDSDAGQKLLVVGTSIELHLLPDGNAATEQTGTATITGRKIGTPKDNLVVINITFKGNGALTDALLA